MKSQHQLRVEEFMRLANQEIPAEPTIPSEAVRLLRAKLIMEEALEAITALGITVFRPTDVDPSLWSLHSDDCLVFQPNMEPNLEQIADGCADISVVTIGTLTACGIHDKELLEEVDRSNLAKFEVLKCGNRGRHVLCKMRYKEMSDGIYVCPVCGLVARGPYLRSDGKWVKGPDWQPPDIAGVLERQVKVQSAIDDGIRLSKTDSGCISVIEDDGEPA